MASEAEPAACTVKPLLPRYSVGKHLNQNFVFDQQNAAWLSLGVDDVPEFFRERCLAERFGYKVYARIQPSVMDDGIARIPRREQNFQVGPALSRLFCQLASIHAAGQPDIGEQHQNFGMAFEKAQPGCAGFS